MQQLLSHYRFMFLALVESIVIRIVLFINHDSETTPSYELDGWHHSYTALIVYITCFVLFRYLKKPFPWYLQAFIIGVGLDQLYVPICKVLCDLGLMDEIVYFSRFEVALVVIGYLLFIIFNLVYKPFYDSTTQETLT